MALDGVCVYDEQQSGLSLFWIYMLSVDYSQVFVVASFLIMLVVTYSILKVFDVLEAIVCFAGLGILNP